MRDINNLINELTLAEEDFLKYLLDELIKAQNYKFFIDAKQLRKLGYTNDIIKSTIRLLAVAEIAKHGRENRKKYVQVGGRKGFEKLIKRLGVR
ncbi:hypothetical protein [Cellulosilyticum sp. WCF-2]|uniref:hypothetical protein n=1 Tax=Cellulosilyticum sp. WCF-2 TaxID=2497860 RepID=UPI000F8D712D|nr:hypothetical protein [Cellulosilyticum sp. WCF-2]QEH68186.1 hypothetical protein EKH84_07205 [Cellulosilyticum sp. WCF-2]